MKKFKVIIAVIMSVAMILTFIACNKGGEDNYQSGTDNIENIRQKYIDEVEQFDFAEIEPHYFEAVIRDVDKYEQIESTALSDIRQANNRNDMEKAYERFFNEVKELLTEESEERARDIRTKMQVLYETYTSAPGKEAAMQAEYEKLAKRIVSYNNHYNDGLLELLKLRLYAYTCPDYKTENKRDIIKISGIWSFPSVSGSVSNTVEFLYGDQTVEYDIYSDGGMVYENKRVFEICGIKSGTKLAIGYGIPEYFSQSINYLVSVKKDGKIIGYVLFWFCAQSGDVTITDSCLFVSDEDGNYPDVNELYLKSLFSQYTDR